MERALDHLKKSWKQQKKTLKKPTSMSCLIPIPDSDNHPMSCRNISTIKGSQSFFRKSLEKVHSAHRCPLCNRGFEDQSSLDATIRSVSTCPPIQIILSQNVISFFSLPPPPPPSLPLSLSLVLSSYSFSSISLSLPFLFFPHLSLSLPLSLSPLPPDHHTFESKYPQSAANNDREATKTSSQAEGSPRTKAKD